MIARTTATRCVVSAVVAVAAISAPTDAATAPGQPQPVVAKHMAAPQVSDALRALAVLHSYGYTINTSERAERAIRHWQRANGLTVDGVVGAETLASLGLNGFASGGATATAPAVRDNLPPEPAADTPVSVEQIVRDAWPDELEQHAVDIAWRESRLQPGVRNACCWGLFQINWSAHRGWLAGIGVTGAGQLLDAATNARAAFALYQRDGWRPWNL